MYETQVLVPLILYSTAGDLPAGRSIERPVRLLDVMPTVLDYAGVPIPPELAGRSLLPLLHDPAGSVELPERFAVETEFRGSKKSAIYSTEWVYVEHGDSHVGTSPVELQKVGEPADGSRTSVAVEQGSVVEREAAFLARWRERHPRQPRTTREARPSQRMQEQLRALGYID